MGLKNKNIPKKESSTKNEANIVSEPVGNYEKHPFFIKKAKAAKEFLSKVGLPDAISEKVKV
jgi:hypothetical protein